MAEQNRDDFYEGPPLEEEGTWHEGAVIGDAPHEGVVAGDDADEFEPGPPLDHDRSEPLTDVDIPERGAYPLPEVTERPHEAADSRAPAGILTRDPSLSRAADREAHDAPITGAGYDRSIEGESAGPLGPDAQAAPPGGGGVDEPEGEEGELPAGQWGSSGSLP